MRVGLCADANDITIVAAGAVPPLIALLASPSVDVQRAASGALNSLAVNGTRARLSGLTFVAHDNATVCAPQTRTRSR